MLRARLTLALALACAAPAAQATPPDLVQIHDQLLAVSADLEELKDQIHVTLVHEIAHFYGLDDAQLHELGWA